MTEDHFHSKGWIKFPAETATLDWVKAARAPALAAMDDPAQSKWWRCDHTWFVGVDSLPNDAEGRVNGGPALAGEAASFIHKALQRPQIASHRGQVSVCLPGYPKRGAEETDTQHNFRVKRDSAHLDGMHGEGTPKRRRLRELHDFILGIALDDGDAGAAPFVVWEGSHLIMRKMFDDLHDVAPDRWSEIDFTERYKTYRARVFKTCRRVVIPARAGEAYIGHRFSIHGVAPWGETTLPQRAIIYFRPCNMPAYEWLIAP